MKLHLDLLEKMCRPGETSLWKHLSASRVWTEDLTYLYADRGSSVLAVAHVDTVFGDKPHSYQIERMAKDTVVFSPALDDRLGVHVILNVLPHLGIKTDILLTTNEECCQSTAEDYVKYRADQKQYNWIVEFDRSGVDTVLYEYGDCDDLVSDLRKMGFRIGWGTYTDICDLEELGAGAFNLGIGYHLAHSHKCFCSVSELSDQLFRFKRFYDLHKDTKYTYIPDTDDRWWESKDLWEREDVEEDPDEWYRRSWSGKRDVFLPDMDKQGIKQLSGIDIDTCAICGEELEGKIRLVGISGRMCEECWNEIQSHKRGKGK